MFLVGLFVNKTRGGFSTEVLTSPFEQHLETEKGSKTALTWKPDLTLKEGDIQGLQVDNPNFLWGFG